MCGAPTPKSQPNGFRPSAVGGCPWLKRGESDRFWRRTAAAQVQEGLDEGLVTNGRGQDGEGVPRERNNPICLYICINIKISKDLLLIMYMYTYIC